MRWLNVVLSGVTSRSPPALEKGLDKHFHQTIAEVAKGSIDRSRDSAKYIQTAATAIAALYTGLLTLVFSVTDHPLPVRGMYATIFLGLAVALSTAYLAFLTKPRPPDIYEGGASLSELQLYRTGYLTKWINATVNDRRWAIRASVLGLAVGVAFIPAAFVATSRPASIPAAPAAPAIPGQVAESVSKEAAKLFQAQTQGYAAAIEARNAAIEDAATQAKTTSEDEADANKGALWLALVGLFVVLVLPWLYGKLEGLSRARS